MKNRATAYMLDRAEKTVKKRIMAWELRHKGWTYRGIAEVLDVSPTRAHQYIKEANKRAAREKLRRISGYGKEL